MVRTARLVVLIWPLSGECLDPVRLGVVEGYVHDGGWASLQDWDQSSGPEPARGQRLQSHPAGPMAQFMPPPDENGQGLASQYLQAGRGLVRCSLLCRHLHLASRISRRTTPRSLAEPGLTGRASARKIRLPY